MPHSPSFAWSGLIVLFVASIHVLGVHAALRNITIDDANRTMIDYIGNWGEAKDGTFGLHHITDDREQGARARFRFKGVALYFMSPKWPYSVGTDLTLFTGVAVSWSQSLDLQDYEQNSSENGAATVESEIVASITDLADTEHSLVIEVGSERPFAIVDQIIYTVDDGELAATKQGDALPVGTIAAIGGVSGVVGLLAIAGLIWFCLKRRRLAKEGKSPPPIIDEVLSPARTSFYPHSESQWGSGSSSYPASGSAYALHLPGPYDNSTLRSYSSDGALSASGSKKGAPTINSMGQIMSPPLRPQPGRVFNEGQEPWLSQASSATTPQFSQFSTASYQSPHPGGPQLHLVGAAPPQYEAVAGSYAAHYANTPEKKTLSPQPSTMSWNPPTSSSDVAGNPDGIPRHELSSRARQDSGCTHSEGHLL